MPLRLERIATQARAYPERACTALAQHLDVAMLERAFQRLNPQSAPGVDRVTWRALSESSDNLAVWKRAAPRNRMREIFTYGSVGGLVE